MIDLEISVSSEPDLNQFGAMGRRAISRAIELLATEVWGGVKKESPKDEGRLAGSWLLHQLRDFQYSISTNVKYAIFVHDGTGIYGPAGHRITPKRANVLAFQWMGETWFRRSVAGQKPNPFADRAIKRAGLRAQEFADIAVREVFG